ncbi:MAG: diaminopimelate decarboxylase [Candidatus Promineifilaceae bacterium]
MSFAYKNGLLTCEDVSLEEIAAEFGTPVYVYSTADIKRRMSAYRSAARDGDLVAYAVKANGNPAILRLMSDAGLGADVTSGGELFLALHAGILPERIVFSGVGKTEAEIEMAVQTGIRALHIESGQELARVAEVARRQQRRTGISIRVNPDIAAETHAYDSTGRRDHKFGVPRSTAVELYRAAAIDPWLQPVGVAAHIGSSIKRMQPYRYLVAFLANLADDLAAEGIRLSYIDVGGGLAVAYEGEIVPSIAEWMAVVSGGVHAAGCQLVVEPGRSLIGPAGVLLTKLLYTKVGDDKGFLIVDAGMNDLIRPALYHAFHDVRLVRRPDPDSTRYEYDVVGPVCESGDFLALGHGFSFPRADDLLAVMDAGAYGFAMSSNYNGRLRPAEVLVNGGDCTLIRRRQTYEHLLDGTSV